VGEKEREVSELSEGRDEIIDKGFFNDLGFHTTYHSGLVRFKRERGGRNSRLTVPSPPRVARYLPFGLKAIPLVTVPFSCALSLDYLHCLLSSAPTLSLIG